MNGTTATVSKELSDFWNDDYRPLQYASDTVTKFLREDENNSTDTDLYRKLASSGPGSHQYYSEDFRQQHSYSQKQQQQQGGAQNISSSSGTRSYATNIRSPYNSYIPSPRSAPAFRRSSANSGPGTPYQAYDDNVPEREAPPSIQAPPLMSLRHRKSIPLPSFVLEKQKQVRVSTFMGLLREAQLVWMTVDSTLYLWSMYQQSTISVSSTSFCTFDVPNLECIISIGLVRPKKGVFNEDCVDWCLVVACPNEIFLCVLARKKNTDSTVGNSLTLEDGTALKLVPTTYSMETDNVKMNVIAGTQSGRIFLGGDDGCVYEMQYDNSNRVASHQTKFISVDEKLNTFYDEGAMISDVIVADSKNIVTETKPSLSKRAWDSLTFGVENIASSSDASTLRPRKCRKVNRTATVSSTLSNILPDFVVRSVTFLLGIKVATGGGKICKMVIDEDRQCLYTLSASGLICSFDLRSVIGRNGTSGFNENSSVYHSSTSLHLVATMDTTKIGRSYLGIVQRGQMPSSYSSSEGHIVFPGSSASAQANVGDKEGARIILKLDKEFNENARVGNRNGSSYGNSGILNPISIHVIPPTESSRMTLLAVTSGGLRYYISALSPQIISNGPQGNTYGGRGRLGNRSVQDPLAPYFKMTLCSIRAPPPLLQNGRLSTAVADSRVDGAVPPSVPNVDGYNYRDQSNNDKRIAPLVDACVYEHGAFISAVRSENEQHQNVSSSRNNKSETALGSMILSICPDVMKRKMESVSTTVSTSNGGSFKSDEFVVPGGMSETVCCSTYSDARLGSCLPGGIVLDMAVIDSKNESLLPTLLSRSRTPTDTELSIDMPPPYIPSRGQRTDGLVSSKSPSTELAIQSRTMAPLAPSALKIFGSIFSNLLLSRPLNYGLDSDRQPQKYVERMKLYRISKSDARNGYSTTAEDVPSSTNRSGKRIPASSSGSERSARLRPWVLNPDCIPLTRLSTLQVSNRREVVILNAGGLHYFEFDTVVSKVSDALIVAENVRSDATIDSCFTAYSYKEGCAMCLGLAIGFFGLHDVSDEQWRKAIDAALSRGLAPKLVESTGNQIMSGASSVNDPMIPVSYEFHPSALCDGLFLIFSRLVRPFWNKPAIVVTEGRIVKVQSSKDMRVTPAKVEILLEENTIQMICAPLRSLLVRMRTVFRPAIKVVPGLSRQGANNMEVDKDDNLNDYHVTRSLQYQRYIQTGDANVPLTYTEIEAIARQIEERNIHSLYRLLARTVQLLDLVSLLLRAQNVSGLREVDWGQLHGLTYRQLAQTSEGQNRIETLLNSLVSASLAHNVVSRAGDKFASLLADRCYLFFSPGSRFTYLGLRRGEEALQCTASSQARATLVTEAANFLRQAAAHWYSAPLITGRTIQRKDDESFYQIASMALEHESPLALAVRLLLQLEDVATIIDICLITASNFEPNLTEGNKYIEISQNQSNYDLPWEHDLYHKKRRPENEKGRTVLNQQSLSSSMIAYGTVVTSSDAIDTCFALIFQCLSTLLNANSNLGFRMVSVCADVQNMRFLHKFFTFLLDAGFTTTLLRIESSDLDTWLQTLNDADILSRYYMIQGRFGEAGQVAVNEACNSNAVISLKQRVYFLSMASSAFQKALEGSQRNITNEERSHLTQMLSEVEDLLQISKFQNRIYQLVEGDETLKAKLTSGEQRDLQESLLDATTLYNDYAARLELYDECLRLLHIYRQTDMNTIQYLWLIIFADELLPCATRSEDVYQVLQTFFEKQFNDSITYVNESVDIQTTVLFERGTWEHGLVRRLTTLGKELYDQRDDCAFPVAYLLGKLCQLREAAPSLLDAIWPLSILVDVGVPYMDIIEQFERRIIWNGHSISYADDKIKFLSSARALLDLVKAWMKSATFDSSSSKVELLNAVENGTLMKILEKIQSQLVTIPDGRSLLDFIHEVIEDVLCFRKGF